MAKVIVTHKETNQELRSQGQKTYLFDFNCLLLLKYIYHHYQMIPSHDLNRTQFLRTGCYFFFQRHIYEGI